jgi:hypothetical protein
VNWLTNAFKQVFGSSDPPADLYGDKSEKEAEEIIEIVHDPEGDEWNEHLPKTNPPTLDPDTPGEIDAMPQEKEGGGFLGWLFGR